MGHTRRHDASHLPGNTWKKLNAPGQLVYLESLIAKWLGMGCETCCFTLFAYQSQPQWLQLSQPGLRTNINHPYEGDLDITKKARGNVGNLFIRVCVFKGQRVGSRKLQGAGFYRHLAGEGKQALYSKWSDSNSVQF